MKPIRLAWISTHPIQYQAPLLRTLSQSPGLDVTALFFSDFSIRNFKDPEFGKVIAWDTPMLDGYKHEFLPGNGHEVQSISTFSPKVKNLKDWLVKDKFDAVLVQGWQNIGMVQAAWLAKRAGLKVLMRCEATDNVTTSTGLKKTLRELVVKFMLSQIDYCMAIGSYNRQFYIDRGFPSEKIGFMPYCVDNDFFFQKAVATDIESAKNKLGMDPDRKVILYVGKLIKRKFADLLIDAYAELPDPKPYLLFAGDGELMPYLQNKIKNDKLDGVRLLGFCNQSELPPLYAVSDIFVLPAINETWGLVVNEAMNAGCAIIATDKVGSAKDLIQDGVNGYRITSQDQESLKTALVKCLKSGVSEKMGQASLEIIKNWGIQENVSGIRKVLGLNS